MSSDAAALGDTNGRPRRRLARRALIAAAGVAIAVRLAVWIGTLWFPIPNEARQPISPLHANSAIDLAFYQISRADYGAWIDRFAAAPLADWGALAGHFLRYLSSSFIAGPFMAGLLALFDYGPGHTLPLSAAYLLLSLATVLLWLPWLQQKGAGAGGLLLFALMPGPLWFMLNVSSDLPFAALTSLFILVFFSPLPARRRYAWAGAIAVVATLLRPHGISLLLFLGAYAVFLSARRTPQQKMLIGISLAVAAAAALLLFRTYFAAYLRSSANLAYFGYLTADYLDGIFPLLPAGLDEAASSLALAAAKFLYLAGLRPSYGDTHPLLVLVRAAPGLILLPGLLYGLFRAPWAYRLLLAAFFAPVALGAAQDRYLLAVLPLLTLFGIRAGREAWGAVTGRRPVFPPLPLERQSP